MVHGVVMRSFSFSSLFVFVFLACSLACGGGTLSVPETSIDQVEVARAHVPVVAEDPVEQAPVLVKPEVQRPSPVSRLRIEAHDAPPTTLAPAVAFQGEPLRRLRGGHVRLLKGLWRHASRVARAEHSWGRTDAPPYRRTIASQAGFVRYGRGRRLPAMPPHALPLDSGPRRHVRIEEETIVVRTLAGDTLQETGRVTFTPQPVANRSRSPSARRHRLRSVQASSSHAVLLGADAQVFAIAGDGSIARSPVTFAFSSQSTPVIRVHGDTMYFIAESPGFRDPPGLPTIFVTDEDGEDERIMVNGASALATADPFRRPRDFDSASELPDYLVIGRCSLSTSIDGPRCSGQTVLVRSEGQTRAELASDHVLILGGLRGEPFYVRCALTGQGCASYDANAVNARAAPQAILRRFDQGRVARRVVVGQTYVRVEGEVLVAEHVDGTESRLAITDLQGVGTWGDHVVVRTTSEDPGTSVSHIVEVGQELRLRSTFTISGSPSSACREVDRVTFLCEYHWPRSGEEPGTWPRSFLRFRAGAVEELVIEDNAAPRLWLDGEVYEDRGQARFVRVAAH